MCRTLTWSQCVCSAPLTAGIFLFILGLFKVITGCFTVQTLLCPLAHLIPSSSSIFPVIVTSGVSFPVDSTLVISLLVIYSPRSEKALLSFRGMTGDSPATNARPAENTYFSLMLTWFC